MTPASIARAVCRKRLTVIALLFVAAATAFIGCASVETNTGLPDPPRGYRNITELKAAIALGLLDLVKLQPEIPATIDAATGVTYRIIDGIELKLDIYKRHDVSEPAPVLVFIHGGSWRSGNRNDYLPYLIDYAEKGYVTATVSYRL